MFKLLVMLLTFLCIAQVLLSLRQQRLETTAESARIYQKIRERNETILDQRVDIARETNPWAIARSLRESGVNTGSALERRETNLGRGANRGNTPTVETDLIAPLLDGRGH